MSYVLDEELVKLAVRIVRPAINSLLGSTITDGRSHLHLVVLKPGSEDILYEESFGYRSAWEHPYDAIACGKARLCQRTGMVARNVQRDAPWLYEKGDTCFVGGVIENGLVVAASGVQDYFDEMISWMVLSAIQGLCRDYIAKLGDDAPNFFGD